MGLSNAFRGGRRGFFFTLVTVVFLSFVIFSVSTWVMVLKNRYEEAPVKFRIEAMQMFASSASQEGLAKQISFVGPRAVRAMAYDIMGAGGYSADSPTASADLCSILINGTRNGRNVTNYSNTLSYWGEALSNYSGRLGLKLLVSLASSSCDVIQFNYTHLQVTIDGYSMSVSDGEGTFINRNYSGASAAVAYIDITGVEDPFITKEDMSKRGVSLDKAAFKQIFFAPYPISSVAPRLIARGDRGKGWVYANLTDDPSVPTPKNYILYAQSLSGLCDEYGDCSGANNFAGIILHLAPNTTTSTKTETYTQGSCTTTCLYNVVIENDDCLDCLIYYTFVSESFSGTAPCVSCERNKPAAPYKNQVKVPFVNVKTLVDANTFNGYKVNRTGVLIDSLSWCNTYSLNQFYVWDMETARDLAVCGYYVPNTASETLLERMATPRSSGNIGAIETFVVGNWAKEDRSRVDEVYYQPSDTSRTKIKGMPGCKSIEMCDDAVSSAIGNFWIDYSGGGSNHLSFYGLNNVRCTSRASCQSIPSTCP